MDVDCRGKRDSVEAAERMMWIGYVGAGVLAAAGVTLRAARASRGPDGRDSRSAGAVRRCGGWGTHGRRLRVELLTVRSGGMRARRRCCPRSAACTPTAA